MTRIERSAPALRQAVFGALTGGVVTALAWGASYGIGSAIDAASPSPDANIGLGLLVLTLPAVVIPLTVWWGLRRLGVPAAGPIASGTIVVYLAMFATPWSNVAATVAAITVYAGLAVLVAGMLAARRTPGKPPEAAA
jgi:hypothetical protein